ncbi:LysR family transcriptional regulator [Burkholderia sp. WAC0059]|uniref:LysR substrate-binding domain-containing protein n=1 Tax=Burkholderia sp. WAC0059 TaxID=2066022 RepID=UPI000C7F23BD|nr:LysR substrate-binding domain-containing protein [Burkholderia sp. WAC0059]PLZ00152.1 LysR family transcriptional regulator [Burkholderia sp. WAC0059]
MDFRQLRYFVRIAELGNMTRASESLSIAQPALSQQIANLEAELGTRLFDRSVQGVRPTQSGDVLYRHAKSLLRQFDDVRAAVSSEAAHPSGRASIGIPGSTGKLLATPLLRSLSNAEGILLEIVERPSAELVDLVAGGKLDISIAVDAQPRRGVAIEPILLEELYVVLPPEDARNKKSLRVKEIAQHPLILPSVPSTIRQRVEAAFLDEHLKYRLVSEVSATDMLIRLVAAGLGWTVLPWSAIAGEVQHGSVAALPVTGRSLQRELALCVSDTLPLSRAAELVRAAVIEIFDDLLASGQWTGVSTIAAPGRPAAALAARRRAGR